jgi:hypothetical protein
MLSVFKVDKAGSFPLPSPLHVIIWFTAWSVGFAGGTAPSRALFVDEAFRRAMLNA